MNNLQIPKFTTIGEAWLCTVRHCLANGREYKIERGSYVGQKRRLVLERWEHNPQVESTFLSDTLEPSLEVPLFLDVTS